MKNSIVFVIFLHCWLLVTPSHLPADQVHKSSVILKEVRDINNAEGILIAKESIYGGGISQNPSAHTPRDQNHGVVLREFRSPTERFTVKSGETTITSQVIPLVTENNQPGLWNPANGEWVFKNSETNSYESVIHVKKGGDLDIVYQSTGMRRGGERHVLHYGLNGNPHAVSLSRTRLKKAFASQPSPSNTTPVLNYQPADDIILVEMAFTQDGFVFQPIFDYQVIKQ
ncbi:hypothetical protein [Candidatus Nitronereus thalassa]|uniref:Uncharacterized protein n=1 Tax=Candidatus Nitronereus thalassa TaxID=3020898 RepID=A0ABU3K845_9BACT|nr:hypothetical protein [Candidatus Nitronereus thalassa]MDT7042532.1 hypothetical protein [Candidatus Nitronereus thalassa]